jgi:hypothetical protein
MIATLRLLVCATAMVLAGCVLELAQPGWLVQLGSELLRLSQSRADLREELELGRRLEEESAALVACAHIKQRILNELIYDRLTLIETATRFRELDRIRLNGQPNRFCSTWPGSSEIERYCQQIIQAAKCELYEQPCVAAAVLARLKAEFQVAAESGAFCLLR